MFGRITALAVCILVSACGSNKRPEALVPVATTVAGAGVVDIEVATSRTFNSEKGQFGDGRSRHLNFQSLRISIPPNHQVGKIEWANSYPGNPATDVVTLANQIENESSFLRRVESRLPPNGEVFVFVHGYNTTHEDAAFRFGQMIHDSGAKLVPVAFTWPSRGDVIDYVTDRESSTAARNRLYDLIVLLSRSPKIKGINIFAHSMGCMLTVEMLAQAKLRGNGEFGGKLDAVTLASPDIDVDVFLSQYEIIGKRTRPTFILISRDDRALQASRRLAGNVVRVGAVSLRDPASQAAIKRFGFTVIDMSAVRTGDRSNHTKFANSSVFLKLMGSGLNEGLQAGSSTVGGFIADTAGDILDAPSSLLRTVTGR